MTSSAKTNKPTNELSSRLHLLLILFGVFSLTTPPLDPDLGWHLAYGKYFVETGTFLRNNIFSFTFSDYVWANSYWISQVFLYILYSKLGLFLMSVSLALFFSVFLWNMLGTLKFSFSARSTTYVFVIIFLSLFSITVRPLFFSSFLLVYLVHVLFFETEKVKVLPVLFLLWANVHADFTIGLLIFGFFTISVLINLISRKAHSRNYLSPLFLGIGSILLTLVNPYGFDLWVTLFKEGHPFQFSHIEEWSSFGFSQNYLLGTLLILTVIVFWVFLLMKRKKFPHWYVVVLLIFTVFSLRFQYFIRVFLLSSLPLFINLVEEVNSSITLRYPVLRKKLAAAFHFVLLFSLFGAFFAFVNVAEQTSNKKSWAEQGNYPYDAVQFVKQEDLYGNMFNEYSWGGYLIWNLPQHKTFVDGRMPSWREGSLSVYEDYIDLKAYPAEYMHLLDYYNISWVLDEKDSPLVSYIERNPQWKNIYVDDIAVVYIRR